MSDKLYQEAYKKFNDKQKDTMYDLYMTGINHDGHSWVTYGDVEKSVAIVTEEAYQQGAREFAEWLANGNTFIRRIGSEEMKTISELLAEWQKERI